MLAKRIIPIIKCVSTEEFWEYMCRADFRRVGLHEGRCKDSVIRVVVAPEEVTGFIESRIDQAFYDIRYKSSALGIYIGGLFVFAGLAWLWLYA